MHVLAADLFFSLAGSVLAIYRGKVERHKIIPLQERYTYRCRKQ